MAALTREEILAMPAGPELDALVAERIFGRCQHRDGWVDDRDEESHWPLVGCAAGCGKRTVRRADYTNVNGEPRFSTEIRWAWEVVEKFQPGPIAGDGYAWSWPVEIARLPDSEGPDRAGWCVELAGKEASAASFTLAVCRAALLTTL